MLLWLQSAFGLLALTGLAWAMSENRRQVDWRMVAVALGLQIGLAVLLLQVEAARSAVMSLNAVVGVLKSSADRGAQFVFGYLGGGSLPFEVTNPNAQLILAFQILPLVIFISALAALLWHWRILPIITRGFAFALRRTLGIGGAVGLGAAVNLFMGMVEAPLFIRAYLAKLSRSEMLLLMTVGLATVSGTVLVLYAVTLQDTVPGALGHILTASLISLPAAIMIAKMMIPCQTVTKTLSGEESLKFESSMDAVVQGTMEGLKLFLTIVAILIVINAMVHLADQMLAILPPVAGADLTVQRIFGWLFAPLVWLFGVPWSEAATAGALMGTKTILNEFLAYLDMSQLAEGALSERSELIMLYAMCGFANLGSVGMLISAISTLVPERRAEVAQLGFKSLIAGTLATGMTGAVVGLLPM